MNIEWELEDAGIKAKCNYAKEELEVEYGPENFDDKLVKLAVEKAGYKLV